MPDGMHLMRLLQMIEGSLPALEVMHALHADAIKNAALRDLGAMQRFTDVFLRNLHAKVAAAGYIRRMLVGDRSPAVLNGLKEQLGVMQRTFQDSRAALTALMGTAEARRNESLQHLSQVMNFAVQINQAMRPLLTPLVAPEVFTDAH